MINQLTSRSEVGVSTIFLTASCCGGKRIPSGRLTWNIIMEVWKIIFLSKWVICRFHVNLPGCRKFPRIRTPQESGKELLTLDFNRNAKLLRMRKGRVFGVAGPCAQSYLVT